MLIQSRGSIVVQKKFDLNDFERGIIVEARQGDLSISETTDLQGFSDTTV